MPAGRFSPKESAYEVRAIRATLEVQRWSNEQLYDYVKSNLGQLGISADVLATAKAAKLELTRRA